MMVSDDFDDEDDDEMDDSLRPLTKSSRSGSIIRLNKSPTPLHTVGTPLTPPSQTSSIVEEPSPRYIL